MPFSESNLPKQEREPPFKKIKGEDRKKGGDRKREKEISLEEKSETIEKYLKEDYSVAITRDREIAKEFFSKMNSSQIKELFEKKEFEYFYKAISEWNSFRGLIKKEMPETQEIAELEKKYGYQKSLPSEIKLYKGLRPQTTLLWPLKDRIIKHKPGEIIKIPELENQFALLEREIKKFKERKPEEGLVKIIGFEKFDRPEVRGKEIVEKAAAILPRGLISDPNNLKYIQYIDENDPPITPRQRSSGGYDPFTKEITIHKPKDLISLLPIILPHEWAHSLDPRVINQSTLSMKEQFELIKKWEEIREEEPVKISFYCQSIEDGLDKSKEGWAESIRLLLTDPSGLKEKSEKRYDFFLSMLRKSYPEFDPLSNIEKMKEYDKLLSDLGYESVSSVLKSIEKEFENFLNEINTEFE